MELGEEVYKTNENNNRLRRVTINEAGRAGNILIGRKGPTNFFVGHAGIVMDDDYVIHSVPRDGVSKISMGMWIKSYGRNEYAVKGTSKNKGEAALRYAMRQEGKPYSSDFYNKNRTDQFYCSQLVWKAWKIMGYDLDRNGGYVVTPTDIRKDGDTTSI